MANLPDIGNQEATKQMLLDFKRQEAKLTSLYKEEASLKKKLSEADFDKWKSEKERLQNSVDATRKELSSKYKYIDIIRKEEEALRKIDKDIADAQSSLRTSGVDETKNLKKKLKELKEQRDVQQKISDSTGVFVSQKNKGAELKEALGSFKTFSAMFTVMEGVTDTAKKYAKVGSAIGGLFTSGKKKVDITEANENPDGTIAPVPVENAERVDTQIEPKDSFVAEESNSYLRNIETWMHRLYILWTDEINDEEKRRQLEEIRRREESEEAKSKEEGGGEVIPFGLSEVIEEGTAGWKDEAIGGVIANLITGSKGGIFKLLALSGTALGVAAGAIVAPVAMLAGAMVGVVDVTKKIVGVFGGVLGSLKTFLSETKHIGKAIKKFDQITDFFRWLGKIVDAMVKSKIDVVVGRVTDGFREIKNLFGLLQGPIGTARKSVGFIGNFLSKFGSIAKMAFKFGRFFGPIGLAITAVTGAFEVFTGITKGFKKGGIIGAVKGGLQGLFKTLVGDLLNLIRDGLAWALNAMGLTKLADMIKSFDFNTAFEKMMDAWFDFIEWIMWRLNPKNIGKGNATFESEKAKKDKEAEAKKINPESLEKNEYAKRAMGHFQSEAGGGYTKEQAAGLVGNLMVESDNFAEDVISGKRKGDNGKAVGIAQWHPDRQAEFERVMGRKLEGSSFDEQLKFMTYELTKGKEQKAGRKLRGADSAEDAGAIVDKYYERSSGEHRGKRMAYAEALAGVEETQPQQGGLLGWFRSFGKKEKAPQTAELSSTPPVQGDAVTKSERSVAEQRASARHGGTGATVLNAPSNTNVTNNASTIIAPPSAPYRGTLDDHRLRQLNGDFQYA